MSKKCAWYKKGKLREIFEFDPVEMSREDGNMVVEPGRQTRSTRLGGRSRIPRGGMRTSARWVRRPGDLDEDEDELSTLYNFIEVCVPGPSRRIDAELGLANPRAPIALDDEDDDREEEEDMSAGEVIFTDEKVRREWLEGRNGTTKLVFVSSPGTAEASSETELKGDSGG
ncbi:hypothetical protein FOMPIDRAFT_1056053 [Fomitopsis schrenkii]|uniref:Uncharacterized protein n=1 Tax=Fomitopsis schrenkii TaxID=2126942 RepID=S8DQ77_FOMSC|nr:hypothetical protein FOMPIDRAFT_1056053 [Fomitopsis schrenkii]